jgi:hypothetical protein
MNRLRSLERRDRCRKFLRLVKVLLAASRKRGTDDTNIVKNNFRSSLRASSVNDLMMMSMNGSSLEYFDTTRSIEH